MQLVRRNPFFTRAVARYGARYARNAFPRLNAAYKVGRFVYNNRSKIKSAFMKGRQVVKYVRSKRKSIVARRMEPSPKRHCGTRAATFQTSFEGSLEIGKLQVRSMIMPVWNPGSQEMGNRTTLNIMLKGFKICRQFYFGQLDGDPFVGPIKITYYLVQNKNANESTDTFANRLPIEMFRSNVDNLDRATDFDITSPNWDSTKLCAPLNPDNNINILKKMTKVLMQDRPTDGQALDSPWKYTWQIDRYIKFGKLLHWEKLDNFLPTHPIYEVYWYETLNPSVRPTSNQPRPVDTWSHHILYYGNKASST